MTDAGTTLKLSSVTLCSMIRSAASTDLLALHPRCLADHNLKAPSSPRTRIRARCQTSGSALIDAVASAQPCCSCSVHNTRSDFNFLFKCPSETETAVKARARGRPSKHPRPATSASMLGCSPHSPRGRLRRVSTRSSGRLSQRTRGPRLRPLHKRPTLPSCLAASAASASSAS